MKDYLKYVNYPSKIKGFVIFILIFTNSVGGMRGQACLPTLATVSSIFTMGAFFGTGEGFLDLVELLGYVLFELLSLMYVHCTVYC